MHGSMGGGWKRNAHASPRQLPTRPQPQWGAVKSCPLTGSRPLDDWREVVPARPMKRRPAYAVDSVDHALRIAAMLQLEGALTVSQIAERLGVARSTAHRLLAMLVYRDFAVQDEERVYHPGPVLELLAYPQSYMSQLRAAALPHMQHLVELLDETIALTVRTGVTARFIASVESNRVVRVGSREGMVFPAHRTSGGLLLLAELSETELEQLYSPDCDPESVMERPSLLELSTQLARARRSGFVLNEGGAEQGVVAVGVPVRDANGRAVAGLSVAAPSARYDAHKLPAVVGALKRAAAAIELDLNSYFA